MASMHFVSLKQVGLSVQEEMLSTGQYIFFNLKYCSSIKRSHYDFCLTIFDYVLHFSNKL
jgi:hypothetical protein